MLGINQKMGVVDPVAFDDFTKVIQELKDTRHFYDSYIKDYEDGIAEISFVHRYVIPWLIMVIMICAFSRLEKAIKK